MADLNFNTLKIAPGMFTPQEKLTNAWHPYGEKGITREVFLNANPNMTDVFEGLDTNKDGIISEREYTTLKETAGDDGILTDQERHDAAMSESIYFARRNVDKWFKQDKNRDGHSSLVETRSWTTYNNDGTTLEGERTLEELTPIYGEEGADGQKHDVTDTRTLITRAILEDPNIPEDQKSEVIQRLCSRSDEELQHMLSLRGSNEFWLDEIIKLAKERYGVDLTEEDITELQLQENQQANNWLFKDGDGKDAPLYCQLNVDAYSRLLSIHNGESCCGGNICEFPDFDLDNLERNGYYTAKEMKARLNWASRTSIENIPEGATDRPDLGDGTVALMTDNQIEMYKRIVEEVTGQPWDSDGWVVTVEQFLEIGARMNGTHGDETRMNGKTRADIPENRQDLLHYLEEHGMLLEQFEQ